LSDGEGEGKKLIFKTQFRKTVNVSICEIIQQIFLLSVNHEKNEFQALIILKNKKQTYIYSLNFNRYELDSTQ
jgi:hypothetical protein